LSDIGSLTIGFTELITGQWGKPGAVLLDLVQEPDGKVRGLVNPGRQHAEVRHGVFDPGSGVVQLEGEHVRPDGALIAFRVSGRLEGGTLRLKYSFGDLDGRVDLVRVEDYRPPRLSRPDGVKAIGADIQRWFYSLSRPSRRVNETRLRQRNESLSSIVCRDATSDDVPALAELHVETWNATYRTSRGPTVATRSTQWQEVFSRGNPQEFVIVLDGAGKRLIGFCFGTPSFGEFEGVISKIFLRWEYHGLGLGRRLMEETARRFLERGIESCVLFAERSNPTIGFYDRMGGERLLDERGLFTGAYGWRDVRTLLNSTERG
jgi:ribosomal protein S18 acetylase RimI-like enzyme